MALNKIIIIGVIAAAVIIIGVSAVFFTNGNNNQSSSTTNPTGTTTLPAVTLSETGSTLLYPLFNLWVPAFTTTYPNAHITTAGTGSGTGISQASTGTVQIGASDAYMLDSQMSQTPGMLNIPLAISAQQINYNVPEIPASEHLNLSGPVLAGIYSGSIKYWDDPQIKDINSAVASLLPHQLIIPIHRSDGSGDTFIFTQYLTKSTPSWNNTIGFGTTVNWPSVPSSQAALGNGGMVQACAQNKYSIAYIGVSFFDDAKKAGLGYAFLQNKDGNFVDITTDNIKAAASTLVSQTPADERISLVYAPGPNSYPIINYEYAIVKETQPNTDTASALSTFLNWALDPNNGNSPQFLDQVHFIPLPPSIVQLSKAQIAQIQ